MPDDKRTKLGPIAPVRPATGRAAVAVPNPTPVPAVPSTHPGTPPPAVPGAEGTAPPGSPTTSYLPPQTDPLLGQVLAGRYVLHKKLGEGGMGAVYLATHNVLEKQVALKVLHGEFARKPDLVERFMQEAKAASRIRHENVIDISDFGATPDGMVFFAMELLKGHDLHEEIARARLAGQLLPWERSKRIFLQICAALSAAHALGIIHRDLKPENIYLVEFLGEPDFVKLLDFGIAKLTETEDGDRKLTKTGMLFGTPEYMSPEQARGDKPDHRVDVYAMGCILFQLVTGRVPFEAENFMGVLSLHLVQAPPVIPPEVFDSIGAPRALAQVIDHALAKDREQRIASIDEFARAVRRVSGDKATGPVVAQGNVTAPPSTATFGRVKTQWTGNLSVPEMDAGVPPRKSKLPQIIGAAVLVGAAAVAALVLTRGGASQTQVASAPNPTGTDAVASTEPGKAPPPTGPGVPGGPPPTPPVASSPPALAFSHAQIRLGSAPDRAEVRDLSNGKLLGKTPLSFTLPASYTPRQLALHKPGYVDTVVEIVPDRETIDYAPKLERGAAGAPAVVHRAPDPGRTATPAAPPDGPGLKPDPGKPETKPPEVKPPEVKPPEVKPETRPPEVKPPTKPPEVPDPDEIQLKADPSRTGSGSGSP